MKFIKVFSPKLDSEIMVNVNNIVYLNKAYSTKTHTFIHTTTNILGVSETIDEIEDMISNNGNVSKAKEIALNALNRWNKLEGGFDGTEELENAYKAIIEILNVLNK